MKTNIQTLCLALALLAGCSKKEAPITGSPSAPPVSLQCVWKPGHTYVVRLEMEQTTDIEPPNPIADNLHRVCFEQVCQITVTNAPAGQLRLDLEVLSLGMERSKAHLISTGFDSEQGGEIFDDSGYVPVLKKLVGGKLRFTLSADGRVVRTDGLTEWLERALGISSSSNRTKRPPSTGSVRVVTSVTNADGTVRTTTSLVRAPTPTPATTLAPPLDPPPPPPPPGATANPIAAANAQAAAATRSSTASAIRGFFNADLFKQILEFGFLPTTPVRVSDQWQAQGETPITGRGRPRYSANVKFTGWQRLSGTNCVRLDIKGTIAQRASNKSKKDGTLNGVLWIDVESQFPAAAAFDKDAAFPSNSSSRSPDTNEVANAAAPKRIHQYVGIRLLSITPTQTSVTSPAIPPTSPATPPPPPPAAPPPVPGEAAAVVQPVPGPGSQP